jgi:UDP-glucose 4-epimerase
MKIFITGVAGFLGSHLADRMLALGHTVAGNDNLLGGYRDNVDPRVEFYAVDCCDRFRMIEIIHGADVVVHCAATAHEGLSVFSPDFITKNIFQASVSTISAAVTCNIKPRPVDPYGIAKVASEDTLKVLAETHGMEWNIAVPHNIVGPRQRYDDPFRNVLSIMINRNLQGKPAIIYGDGEQTRCFSYIDDCIFCLEKMVLDPGIVYQTINIGPDESTITINELAGMVTDECNFSGKPVYFADRPREVKNAMCSSDKARELLGYSTTVGVRQAVKRTADWIKGKGAKPFDYSFPLEIINDKTPKTWKDRLM